MNSVEIVFFDAGETLLRPEPSVGRVYARAGRGYGLDATPEDIETTFRAVFAAKKRHSIPLEREWWRQVVADTFAPFGVPSDPKALFDELCEHFALATSWSLYPEAIETVEALRDRGYRTGLISNWDDRLAGILEGLGLADLLEPMIVSCDVGVEKPDPRIFRIALDRAQVAPERALMVGDNREADIEGARAVGMNAVLVDHHAMGASDGRMINGLSGLLDFLPQRRF
jgi:putative hydrolase of the HAD superfamily